MKSKKAPSPDDLPRSPSGRVPQWVKDEAAGQKVDPVPFRAFPSSAGAGGSTSKRRRVPTWTKTVLVVALIGALVFAVNRLGVAPPLQTGSGQSVSAGPPPGNEESASRLLPAPKPGTGPSSSHFRFLDAQSTSTAPVTWSPCRPIHYVVRTANAPLHGSAMIAEAFARLSAATGLTVVNDGPTTEAPSSHRSAYQPDRYGDRWAPVLIAWATPAEVPDFGVDIAGEAGPYSVQAPDGTYVYVSGDVYLDPAKIGRAEKTFNEGVARSVVLHELGHLAGLAHVDDSHQIMWPRGNSTRLTEYQQGDLAGLAKLGAGACHPDV